jgi:hypothetical protein
MLPKDVKMMGDLGVGREIEGDQHAITEELDDLSTAA